MRFNFELSWQDTHTVLHALKLYKAVLDQWGHDIADVELLEQMFEGAYQEGRKKLLEGVA